MAVDQSGNYKLTAHIDDFSALWGTVVQTRTYGCDAAGARDDDHVRAASSSCAIVDGCADIGGILLSRRRQSVGICTPQCHCKYQENYAMGIHSIMSPSKGSRTKNEYGLIAEIFARTLRNTLQ